MCSSDLAALAKDAGNLAGVAFSDDHPVVDAIVKQAIAEAPGLIDQVGWTPDRVATETLAALGRLQAQMTSAPVLVAAPAK